MQAIPEFRLSVLNHEVVRHNYVKVCKKFYVYGQKYVLIKYYSTLFGVDTRVVVFFFKFGGQNKSKGLVMLKNFIQV